MSISKQQINEIKSKVVLSDFLDREIGLSGLKRSGKDKYKCACPFHNGVKNNFEINDAHEHWQCWSDDCGGGDVYEALKLAKGISFFEAVKYVADAIGYKIQSQSDDTSFVSNRSSSVFSNELYNHFKFDGFNHQRDCVTYALNVNANTLNGVMRCDPLKIEAWSKRIDDNPELKKAVTELGFDNSFHGLLDESYILHPVWKVKRCNPDKNDYCTVQDFATGNGLASLEVVGFNVYDGGGVFVGTFPQQANISAGIGMPILSSIERMRVDNSKLIACDTLKKYEAYLNEGTLNVVYIGAELNFMLMNSLMLMGPQKELVFDCTEEFYQNTINRRKLFELMGRVLSKSYDCFLSLGSVDKRVELWDYCSVNVPHIDTNEELFSLSDAIRNIIRNKGFDNKSLDKITDTITCLDTGTFISSEQFAIDYLGSKKVSKVSKDNYRELLLNYGEERNEKVVDAFKYFDLRAEDVFALDVYNAIHDKTLSHAAKMNVDK